MTEEIILRLDDDNNLVAEVKGHKGPGCKELTKAIEKLGTVLKDEKTTEYDERGNSNAGRVHHRN